MLAKVTSCAVVGLDGALVDVEVDISTGQPGFMNVVPGTQTICPAQSRNIAEIGGDGCGVGEQTGVNRDLTLEE